MTMQRNCCLLVAVAGLRGRERRCSRRRVRQRRIPANTRPPTSRTASRLYDAQCTTCHGANGDGVGGVDLRSGKFRNAVTDQDLTRVITTGIPGTGMQAFKFDPSEIAGIIAYLRNMNSFDAASVKAGDAGRGRAIFDGKGDCTALPPRRRARARAWRPT